MPTDPPATNPEPLQQRLTQLKQENTQLRDDVADMTRLDVGRPVLPTRSASAPFFRPLVFQRKFIRIFAPLMALMFVAYVMPAVVQLPRLRSIAQLHIGSARVFDFAGKGTLHNGLGLGLISWGGVSLGVIAIGGLGIGFIALGGGAIGVIAIGGGACGILAIGGGAFGIIAVGGSATGYFALGQRGSGKSVFALNRQDPLAVEFFTKFFPSLRECVASPMPVIPK